jgi:hypothetical protein
MTAEQGLKRWQEVVENGNSPEALAAIIDEDAVFHSPVVHTPQRGRPIVVAYLSAAGQTLGNDSFEYVRELVDGENAMIEFRTEIDGIEVNGIDLIHWNMNQEITEFRVWLRPLKGLQIVQQLMATKLSAQRYPAQKAQ